MSSNLTGVNFFGCAVFTGGDEAARATRLNAYESTGLEPEEIERLKRDVEAYKGAGLRYEEEIAGLKEKESAKTVKGFLDDYIELCQTLEDASDDAEYYGMVKANIREFKKKHKGIWAEAFIALLRAMIEEDVEAVKDPRGMTGAVWSLRDKMEVMVERWKGDKK